MFCDGHDTCCVLGMRGGEMKFQSVRELKEETDFKSVVILISLIEMKYYRTIFNLLGWRVF